MAESFGQKLRAHSGGITGHKPDERKRVVGAHAFRVT
jgi:hypothetical protein